MDSGDFGLERESKIILSGIRNVFTPHIPVDEISHFFGRENEAKRLVSLVHSPGQHILLFGDRGVGKTSLAKTTCNMILKGLRQGPFFEKRCDSNDTFETLFIEPLRKTGVDVYITEETSTHNEGGSAGIKALFAKADIKTERGKKSTRTTGSDLSSPSWVANQLRSLAGIMLIGEADALVLSSSKRKIAELIKQLSDMNSKFKVIVVGVASTGEELTDGHPSIERCLKEVSLQRMADDDLKKIILNGMKKLDLRPKDEVVEKIVDISAGFPHFTHLISLKCGEVAIDRDARHIDMSTLQLGLDEAVKDSEGSLQRMFEASLRTMSTPKDYKILLLAASHCSVPEFRSHELRDKLKRKYQAEISSQALSKRLGRLAQGNRTPILIKTGRGCFQFSDPRMPSYIKMVLNSEPSVV